MADEIRTVASITREGKGPSPHACDAPGLSPIEFMLAVMRDTTLPLAIRLDAAAKVAPFYHRRLRSIDPHYTIVIPPLSLEPWADICSPWPRSTANCSQNPSASNTALSHGGDTQAPVDLTTDTETQNPEPSSAAEHLRSGPSYSDPPTPAELQEIKAAINRLRPDLAHLPVPEFHLCPCGHWITGEYDCCRELRSRDPSKLN